MQCKGILIGLIIMLGTSVVSADTIDYWHIYYNSEKIKEFSQNSTKKDIRLSTSSIEAKDSIIVRYFTDTPCRECPFELQVYDTKKNLLLSRKSKGKGMGAPVAISLKDLLRYTQKTGTGTYHVYLDSTNYLLCDLQMK